MAKALESRTLVFDGGMGTQIHACTDCMPSDYLGRDNCTDILVKSRPDIIQRIHENYFAAGADVVETDSFGANILVGREFDEELAARMSELPKDKRIIAHCSTGVRAEMAYHKLKEAGYKVGFVYADLAIGKNGDVKLTPKI